MNCAVGYPLLDNHPKGIYCISKKEFLESLALNATGRKLFPLDLCIFIYFAMCSLRNTLSHLPYAKGFYHKGIKKYPPALYEKPVGRWC